jgi:hypothetical protein
MRAEGRPWWMNKWIQPIAAFVLGLIVLAAFWIGGDPVSGAIGLGVIAGFGALLLLGGRSDTIRGMRGDGRDERWEMIDLRATALAGFAVITAVIVGFIVEVAHGRDGSPFTWLGAIGGIAYLVGILIGRWRS